MTQPHWPNGAKAAISFTMDNLGEAQDVNLFQWDAPLGSHPSVKEHLPRMLDMLDEHGIKATYFVESWSLGVYADVVRDMARRGHEVAWHGYQHERWPTLSEDDEVLNFQRSFAAAEEFGVRYDGFRPPGGLVNDRTWDLLRRHGVKYISPLGKLEIREGVVVLPFDWKAVDAFYYMEKFGPIREAHGEQTDMLSPSYFEEHLLSMIRETVEAEGYMSILFHPFLQESEEKLAVMERVLGRLASDTSIWCAPCRDVADWVARNEAVVTPAD
ncbi:uncharacterized protein DNG_02190 [Cephalotrichum gorgonifer]|uniref:NodB homology domain-containing protein n=1 Tax=Cephalotrichum gorgonifer TaxID=2041049 RepID=A0AAE8MU24_9PEZI|nr:uncharacterized protein DNG_02190 [Cephalotrichum gorgonifer]